MNRVLFGVSVLLGVSLVSAGASAGQGGMTSYANPGVACRSQNSNVSAWYSSLYNWGAGNQTVWCPVQYYSVPGGEELSDVYVDVNSGWATTSSCNLVTSTSPNSFWVHAPTSISHNGALDTLNWTAGGYVVGQNTNYGVEVECYLPQGGQVYDYRVRTFLWFDWTTW
jgi:hypothetical protein